MQDGMPRVIGEGKGKADGTVVFRRRFAGCCGGGGALGSRQHRRGKQSRMEAQAGAGWHPLGRGAPCRGERPHARSRHQEQDTMCRAVCVQTGEIDHER